MQLHQVLGWHGPVTHRQIRAWQLYFAADLDVPSRADCYTMQVCATVAGLLRKGVSVEDFKLTFKPRKKLSKEEQLALTKAAWSTALGKAPPK